MRAAPQERVQVERQGRDERFAFAGFHFGDLAFVQNHAADHLHVEMAHPCRADARLAHARERFGQDLFQRDAFRFDQFFLRLLE